MNVKNPECLATGSCIDSMRYVVNFLKNQLSSHTFINIRNTDTYDEMLAFYPK